MPAPNKPLSRRDYQILLLCQAVGIRLGRSKSIPFGLIKKIYQHMVYADSAPVIRRLFAQGFLVWQKKNVSVRIPSFSRYNRGLLFGDASQIVFPNTPPAQIAQNWRNRKKESNLFHKTPEPSIEEKIAKAKVRKKNREQRKAKKEALVKVNQQAFDKANIEQILVDHRAAEAYLNDTLPIPVSHWVIAPKHEINGSEGYIQKILQDRGLLHWKFRYTKGKKRKFRQWFVTERAKGQIRKSLLAPSFSAKDLTEAFPELISCDS